MRKLCVEGGVVTNVIEVDDQLVPEWAASWPEDPGGVGIGWIEAAGGGFVAPVPDPVTNDQVNSERDRRILEGLTVTLSNGTSVPIRGDETTKSNLQGLAVAAQIRIAEGNGSELTAFRDRDNVMHDLTQAQLLELWSESMDFVSSVFGASWALKDDFDPIPPDYQDDTYWPSG